MIFHINPLGKNHKVQRPRRQTFSREVMQLSKKLNTFLDEEESEN